MSVAPPASIRRDDYRPEIDGLRAISVLSVIIYHASERLLPGGFLGVDVFFVISGFLITRHIHADLARGRFSLADFYLRRVRRIAPALLFVCAVTTPFAVWLMLPDDLQNYGQSLFASVASVNNVLLWLTTNYFSLSTAFKPLIHTWSLGIEEQYYVIVPLALALAWKLRQQTGVATILVAGSLASLAAMEVWRAVDLGGNFYLLPSRFWELGLGGIAGIYREQWRARGTPRMHDALAGVSLIAIVGCMIVFRETMNLPSLVTLVPIAGAMGVLVFCGSTGVGRILTTAPFVGIGLISYSAYLIHQPVFALLRVSKLAEVRTLDLALAAVAVLGLAYLTWRYVEMPFRDRNRVSNRLLLALTGIVAGLLMAVGLVLHFTSGLPGRFPDLQRDDPTFGAQAFAQYVDGPFRFEGLPLDGAARERNLLVLGNSYARDFLNMGTEAGAFRGWNVSYDSHEFCRRGDAGQLAKAARAGAVVIVSDEVGTLAHCYQRMVARLREAGVAHVAVIGTKNFGSNNNAVMRLSRAERDGLRVRPMRDVVGQNTTAARVLGNDYVDLLAMLDDGRGTVPVFTPGGLFVSQDRMHLTKPGAAYVGSILFASPQLAWLTPRRP